MPEILNFYNYKFSNYGCDSWSCSRLIFNPKYEHKVGIQYLLDFKMFEQKQIYHLKYHYKLLSLL